MRTRPRCEGKRLSLLKHIITEAHILISKKADKRTRTLEKHLAEARSKIKHSSEQLPDLERGVKAFES